MNVYHPTCRACNKVLTDVDARDVDQLMSHDCLETGAYGRGWQDGEKETRDDVRLHGNRDAPERKILLELIGRLETCKSLKEAKKLVLETQDRLWEETFKEPGF